MWYFRIVIILFGVNILMIVLSKLCHGSTGRPWKSLLPHAPWSIVLSVGLCRLLLYFCSFRFSQVLLWHWPCCSSVNGLLVVYASDPLRTPPYLQALLSCTLIPFTIVARLLILKKGQFSLSISIGHTTCIQCSVNSHQVNGTLIKNIIIIIKRKENRLYYLT